MEDEISSIKKNDTWKLVKLPKARKLLVVNRSSRPNTIAMAL